MSRFVASVSLVSIAAVVTACSGVMGGSPGAAGGAGSAPNLTPDDQTGLGGWRDEDIVSAIRDGIDDEQHTLCSSMPRAHDLSDEEAANIARTFAASRR